MREASTYLLTLPYNTIHSVRFIHLITAIIIEMSTSTQGTYICSLLGASAYFHIVSSLLVPSLSAVRNDLHSPLCTPIYDSPAIITNTESHVADRGRADVPLHTTDLEQCRTNEAAATVLPHDIFQGAQIDSVNGLGTDSKLGDMLEANDIMSKDLSFSVSSKVICGCTPDEEDREEDV